MRCVSGCNAVTLSGHRIGFLEQIYCMGRCRYTATAVEDILNGQRSTTAMGIEICFTHANPANPAIGLEQSNFVRFAGFARVYNNPINTVSKAFYPVALRQSAKK